MYFGNFVGLTHELWKVRKQEGQRMEPRVQLSTIGWMMGQWEEKQVGGGSNRRILIGPCEVGYMEMS